MASAIDLSVGDVLIIQGNRYVLDAMIPPASGNPEDYDDYQFKNQRTGRAWCITAREFLALYGAGEVTWYDPLVRRGDRTSDEDQVDIERRRVRAYYCQYCDASPVPKSAKPLRELVARAAAEHPDPLHKPPSQNTVRRWLRERGEPGNRKLLYMGDRRRRGPQGTRMCAAVRPVYEEVERAYWQNRRLNSKDAHALLADRLCTLNLDRVGEGRPALPIPSYSTVCRHLNAGMTEERAKTRFGHRRAQQLTAVRGGMEAKRILDLAIMDATKLGTRKNLPLSSAF